MKLLDKSPGGFITAAFAFVYGVVLAETWMLTTSSLVAMTAVMALIIALSGVLVRGMGQLMGSEEYALGEPAKTPAPATVAVPVAPATRRRATSHAAHA